MSRSVDDIHSATWSKTSKKSSLTYTYERFACLGSENAIDTKTVIITLYPLIYQKLRICKVFVHQQNVVFQKCSNNCVK